MQTSKELSKYIRCLSCGYRLVERGAKVCANCGTDLEVQRESLLQPGTVIGKNYEIDFPLGQGGFGVTYQAIDLNLHRHVAIKEYFPNQWAWRHKSTQSISVSQNNLGAYSRALKKFEQEGRILANINHPNIVRVYSLFRDLGTAYLVMELLEGETLAERISSKNGREPLGDDDIFHIAKSLVGALSAIHKCGIQHLDIKPDNIMLREDGRVILYDFGAARWDVDPNERLRPKTIAAYTPGYAPLELLQNDHAQTTPATDIYELSVVLYELLTGSRPPDVLERLNMNWEPQLPERWQAMIQAGLAVRASDRPQSAKQWWKLLGQPSKSASEEPPAGNVGWKLKLPLPSVKLPLILGGVVLLGVILILLNMNAQLYIRLARWAAEAQEHDRAADFYGQAIKRNPGDSELWLERGNAYFAQGNYIAAISDYHESIRLRPNSQVQEKLGDAYFAQAELDIVAKNFDTAVERINLAIKNNPNLTAQAEARLLDAYTGMARLRISQQNWQEAIEVYEKLLENQNLPTGTIKELRSELANVYLSLGKEQQEQMKYEMALTSYNLGLKNDPENYKLFGARAGLLVLRNNYKDALSDYNRGLAIAPNRPELLAGRGLVLGQLGKYSEALKDYDLAINQGGLKEPFVYNGRGWVHEQMKSYGNAIADYSEAIRIDPNFSVAYNNRGWAKFYISDYHGAIQDFNKAISNDKNIASAYQGLGYAKTLIKDSRASILADLQNAIRLYQEEGNQTKINEIKEWIVTNKLEE